MERILSRLSEPSTWAGISALAIISGVNIDDDTLRAIQGFAFIFGGGAAAVAVIVPEKKKGKQ